MIEKFKKREILEKDMERRYNLWNILRSPLLLIAEYGVYRPFVSFSTPLISLIEWGHDRIRASNPETQPSFYDYLDNSREELEIGLPDGKKTATGDGRIEIVEWREENLDKRHHLHH